MRHIPPNTSSRTHPEARYSPTSQTGLNEKSFQLFLERCSGFHLFICLFNSAVLEPPTSCFWTRFWRLCHIYVLTFMTWGRRPEFWTTAGLQVTSQSCSVTTLSFTFSSMFLTTVLLWFVLSALPAADRRFQRKCWKKNFVRLTETNTVGDWLAKIAEHLVTLTLT